MTTCRKCVLKSRRVNCRLGWTKAVAPCAVVGIRLQASQRESHIAEYQNGGELPHYFATVVG